MDPAELNKLTPEQKQQVMMNAQMEANTTIMQRMMEIMTKQCFTKCAGSSGDRLDTKEQSCMAMCQDRFLETRDQVREALEKRQSTR